MCRRRQPRQPLLVAAGIAAINAIEKRQRKNQQALQASQTQPKEIYPVFEQAVPAAYTNSRDYTLRQGQTQTQTSQTPVYDLDDLVHELSLHDEKALNGQEQGLPPVYTPHDSQQPRSTPPRPSATRPAAATTIPQSTAPIPIATEDKSAYTTLLNSIPLLAHLQNSPQIHALIEEFILASSTFTLARNQPRGSSGACCNSSIAPQRRRLKWARKALVREVMNMESLRLGGRGNGGKECGIRGREAKRMWREEKRGLKSALRAWRV